MGHSLGNNYGKFYSFGSKPVLLDLQFQVLATDPSGTTQVKGQGVKAVYMHTSATPATGNPNPASGYALVELEYNYTRLYGLSTSVQSPLSGSNLAINGSALTPGVPYTITDVGAGAAGAVTVAPVADTSGSLASKYFSLYDSYGNTFIIWFSVSGVGSAPTGVSGTLVQQTIASGATAAQVGTALAITINALPSGISGVASFTVTGTTTLAIIGTAPVPLAGTPADGAAPLATGFTFARSVYQTNLSDWQHVGLPPGVTPAIGASFVATAAGFNTGGGSSGKVQTSLNSGVTSTEIIGDPNASLAPIPMGGSPNSGGFLIIKLLGPTDSSTTTPIPTAPANGTRFRVTAYLEGATRVGGNQE